MQINQLIMSQQLRGAIYSSASGKLVVPPSLKPIITDVSTLSDAELKGLTYSYTFEGTIVRLYKSDFIPLTVAPEKTTDADTVEPTYRLSTFNKMDAFQTKWGGKQTFGEQFLEAAGCESLSEFVEREQLDTTYVYMYLILSNEQTRIVTHHSKPGLVLLAVAPLGGNVWEFPFPDKTTHVYKTLDADSNPRDEIDNMLKLLPVLKSSGVIGQSESNMYWFIDTHYAKLSAIRNNFESKETCCLYYFQQAIVNKWDGVSKDNIYLCRELYPQEAGRVGLALAQYTAYLHAMYINRFVHRRKVIVDKHSHFILKKCHLFYLLDRSVNVIKKQNVEYILARYTTNPYFFTKVLFPNM